MPEKIAISALICEFDPLHFGHREILSQMRAAGGAVCCIMSGNFVQRGGPAMLDKWSRARLALENGADLVFELPLPWACAGAQRFAAGGVCLAGALGAERLYFGAENPDLALLSALAEALGSPEFSLALARQKDTGQTFAQRRQRALAVLFGEEAVKPISLPNCTLGIEYLYAIKEQNLSIQPVAVQRVGAEHHAQELSLSPNGGYFSAGQLRKLAAAGKELEGLVPTSTAKVVKELRLTGGFPVLPQNLERALLCKLRTMSKQDFAALPDLSEGLENRLYRASRQACSAEELYRLVKCKRYTHSRIRRLATHAFLGVTSNLPQLPPYLRLLGMTELGRQTLGQARPSLPVATRAAGFSALSPEAQQVFALEAAADDLYTLGAPQPGPAGRDYREKIIKI